LEEALKGGLSGLGKTANNRSVAYTRLSIAEKEIERLFPVVLRFKEVRYLDLNTNAISDLSLVSQFPNLLWLNASKNQVGSLGVFGQ
jgi:Leucine-rich repeat (LRR) protein